MSVSKHLFMGMVALALTIAPRVMAQEQMHGNMQHMLMKPAAVVDTSASAAVTYRCPMHPEVTSDKPGKCPQCGMKLEKVSAKAAPAEQMSHSPKADPRTTSSTGSDSVKAGHQGHQGMSEAAGTAGCKDAKGGCCGHAASGSKDSGDAKASATED